MLTIKEHIQYWVESAENDLSVADVLFNSGKYDWCLFIGHLVIEKKLKALFVQKNNELTPPKIHNLLKLAQLSDIKLDKEQQLFLEIVNNFNIEEDTQK
jgi:HEPN domain-containing protein